MSVSSSLKELVAAQPKGVWLKTRVVDDVIHLDLVSVSWPLRGSGLGARALAGLLDVADRFGVRVDLDANPTDETNAPDTFDLARWYTSFGFEPTQVHDDGVRMSRSPRPAVGVDALLAQSKAAPRLTHDQYRGWESTVGRRKPRLGR